MGTITRPKISEKNPYWVEKHRYYELKHFCLQYPIWESAYKALDGLSRRPSDLAIFSKTNVNSDSTARCAEARLFYSMRMDMLRSVAEDTDADLACYILKAVTEGVSYETLKAKTNIPCCKDVYFKLYRRFFWLLNRERR
jgi:hypothetical protein